jgi:hypothetical protein
MLFVCIIILFATGCTFNGKDGISLKEQKSDKVSFYDNGKDKDSKSKEVIEKEKISANDKGNSIGNSINFGIATKQNDWIFYALAGDIYKIKLDGSPVPDKVDTPKCE